jgi:hypothetical protein
VDFSNLSSLSTAALWAATFAFTVIIFIGGLIRFGSIYLTPGLFK